MRLNAWATIAPDPAALSLEVRTVLAPVLAALAGDADPHCLPLWGTDPGDRYTLFSLSSAGVVVASVRVDVPGEGPRVTGRLVRWGRVQVGELAVETSRGHRILTVTLENQVLRAVDDEGDRIAWFIRALLATELGRPLPSAAGPDGGFEFEPERILAIPAPRDPDAAPAPDAPAG